MLPPPLGVHMPVNHVHLEGLFPWSPPSSLALTLFLLPLPWGFLNPEGRDLMETPCLELNVPRSPTLGIKSMGLSIYSHHLQEETSLIMTEQGTGL